MVTPQLASGPTPLLRIPLRAQTVTLIPSLHGNDLAAQADTIHQELALFQLIQNHPDQRRGRLRWDAQLQSSARLRCTDMLTHPQYFAHVNRDGFGPNAMLRAQGIAVPDWYPRGQTDNSVESLASDGDEAVGIWTAFLASPPHRTHLLGGNDFFRGQTRMGAGYAKIGERDTEHLDRLWVMWAVLSVHAEGD